MAFVKREYEYYKYGTEPDATVVGNFARLDKGTASVFSSGNYLKLPEVFNPQSNPWEALFKVKINTLTNGGQIILGQRKGGGYNFYVDINKVRLEVGGTTLTGTTTLQENTTYWFKYAFTGDAYIVKSSTNGVDWVDEINTESTVTATPTSDDCRIGVWYNTYNNGLYNPFLGSIDLNESYININGERWWSGDKCIKVGSWIDDGVVGVFSSANHLTLPTTFKPENNTWEMCFKIHTPVSSGKYGPVLGKYTSDTYYGLRLEISETGKVYYMVSGTSGGQYIFEGDGANTLPKDSDVYMKLSFTGSKYIGEISLDGGVSWIVDREVESTTPLYNWDSVTTIGYYVGRGDSNPGYIDLNESYIKINDKLWWHGTKAYQINVSDKDVYENWKQPVLTSNNSSPILRVSATNEGQQGAWKAFDNNTSEGWCTANNVLTGTLTAIFDKDIYVTSIAVKGLLNQHGHTDTITIFSDTRMQNLIGEKQSYDYSVTDTLVWNFEEPVKVNALSFYGTGTSWVTITNIKITAQQLMPTGTIEDADYSILRNKLYQLAKSKRAYYKYGNEIDANVVGSFGRITDGVAGGFKNGTLLITPDIIDTGSNTWERVIKITAGSDVNTEQSIWGANSTEHSGILLRIVSGGNLRLWMSSNGSSWNLASAVTSSLSLSAYSPYYIKATFNGSQYLVDVSTDGVAYTNYITVNSSTPLYAGGVDIGGHGFASPDTPFLGSIDLNETYIKVDDEIIWTGNSYKKLGSWIDGGVVQGFGGSNYLTLPEVFNPQSNNWEALFKVKINSLTNGGQIILGQRNGGGYSFYVDVNYVRLEVGSDKFQGTSVLQENTTYWFKYAFTGDAYIVKSSTNGVDWVDEINTESTVTTSPTSDEHRIGAWYNTYENKVHNEFQGSIDLTQSYIKINNKLWWHGTKGYEVNLGGNDIIKDWEQPVLTSDTTYGKTSSTSLYGNNRAYYAFDGNITSSGKYLSNSTGGGNVTWQLPEPLKMESFQVYQTTETSYLFRFPRAIALEGSRDGVAWVSLTWTPAGSYSQPASGQSVDVTVNNPDFYNYYRWTFGGAFGADAGVAIGDIKINAQVLRLVGSDTYDYYKDRLLSYSPILNNKLY